MNDLNASQDAIRLYLELKIDYPYISDIRLALVQIYSQLEQYDNAIKELEEWLIASGQLHYTCLAIEEGYSVDVYESEYRDPDGNLVALATTRSKHNTYMSVPLIWTMSNQHHVTWDGMFNLNGIIWLLIIVAVGWHLVFQLYKRSTKVKGF